MEWFKKLSTASKVMVVGVLALILVVLVLLPVAIFTHEESGLMTACDTESGALNYGGACYQVEWAPSQFPLDVYAATSNPEPPAEVGDAVSGAVDLINSRLGFTALRMSSSTSSEIRIDFETAQEVSTSSMTDPGGSALHHREDSRLWCQIRTWNNGTVELVDRVLVHELGHCLGLAHDDFPDSAMYPEMHSDGDRLTRPRITDFDRDLLRGLYN